MDGFQQVKYVPAIYTHCYDSSGTRLFAAGGKIYFNISFKVGYYHFETLGPLPANLVGNYAGIWQ